MNPDNPLTPDEEREIRLTALLMGELSPEEAEAVRAEMASNPELKALYERLAMAFDLLREASSLSEAAAEAAPAKLSSERREKLLAHFKRAPIPGAAVIQKPKQRWSWFGPLTWGVSFILAIMLLLPSGFRARKRSQATRVLEDMRLIDSSVDHYATESLDQDVDISPSSPLAGSPPTDAITSTNGVPNPEFSLESRARYTLAVPKPTPASKPAAEAPPRANQPSFSGGYYAGKASGSFNDRGGAATPAPSAPPAPPAELASRASQVVTGQVPAPASPPPPPAPIVAWATQPGAARPYPKNKANKPSADAAPSKLAAAGGDTLGGAITKYRADADGDSSKLSHPAKVAEVDSLLKDGKGQIASGAVAGLWATPGGTPLPQTAQSETAAAKDSPDDANEAMRLAGNASREAKDRAEGERGLSIGSNRDLSGFDSTVASGSTVTSGGGVAIAPAKPLTGEKLDGAKLAHQEPTDKAPTLGDIPLAGRLFANQAPKLKGANTFTGTADFEGVINYGAPISGEGKGGAAGGGALGATSFDTRDSLLSKSDGKWEIEKGKLTRADGRLLTGKDLELKPESQEEANTRLAPPVDEALLSTDTLKNQPQTQSSKEQAEIQKAEPAPQPDAPASRPAPSPLIPQPEVTTSANAFSTFSLNVSDVAFKLAAASLEQGNMPEATSMRSEEFINAFDYRDPQPVPGAPLAFTSERARYPFAQNRDLLRLSIKTAAAGREPGRALNLVLVLDNSGSMERADRVHIVKESLRVLAAQLQPQDKLSIITFSRTPRLWIDGAPGNQAVELTSRVGEITPEGGTNLDAALNLAYQTAHKHYDLARINRVVLLTDGAANLGDVNPAELKRKVEAQRKQGIALDCFGVGWEGYNDDLLEQLSRNGDGRYGFINSPEEASTEFAAQLAGALRVAASDVKVQIEFNPRRVTAYRQIGYAKHQLTKEQFRDNTVDAAEIGAAEAGNALYVIEVNPRGEGDLATVRARFRVPGTSDYREHEWIVPFTPSVPALEQASPAMRLAGTASAFSEWLAGNPYAAEVTSDRLLGLINGVPATFSPDPRPGKLEWMIRQAKSIKGN